MADEFRIHDAAVPRYIDGIGSADRKKAVERVGPRRQIGIGIDCRVAGFFDEITGEDHGPLTRGTRHRDDEIRVGVAAPRPCDGHLAVPQVDDCVVNGALGRPQCGDRVVDLSGVGSVTQGIVAKLRNIGEVVRNFRCAEYLSIWEASAPRSSQLFTLVGAAIVIPIILAYTILAYWVFRGKVRQGDEGSH